MLVVDDSASTCLLIASALQQKGYDVTIALNGQEGLTKAMTLYPHCLILDVLLPGINGYTICRHVCQQLGQQRPHIILMSSKDAPLDQQYGLRQGADRYLPKPFSEETLLQTVWEGMPAAIRQTVAPPSSGTPPSDVALEKLIPRRVPNLETMRSSSPFARSTAIKDELARLLYGAIDGRKTVAELAAATGLETRDVFRGLRILLQIHCIDLHDSAGQPVEVSFGAMRSQGNEAPSSLLR